MAGVCLECGTEMICDWVSCPNCGWKAPDSWEIEDEISENIETSSVFLSKQQPWISPTVWILLAVSLVGVVLIIYRHF